MAKKSMIARDVKRKKMTERYAAKRAALMQHSMQRQIRCLVSRFIARSKLCPATVLQLGSATVVGLRANPVVFTATLAFAAINCANGPTRENYQGL